MRVELYMARWERRVIENLQENTIKGLWHHPRLSELRRYHAKDDLEKVAFCQYCQHRHFGPDVNALKINQLQFDLIHHQ
jgi:hypothetical protein